VLTVLTFNEKVESQKRPNCGVSSDAGGEKLGHQTYKTPEEGRWKGEQKGVGADETTTEDKGKG